MKTIVLLLAVAAACFAAIIFYELRPQPDDPVARVTAVPPDPAAPRVPDLADGTRAPLVGGLLARPLFSYNRRAPDGAKPADVAASARVAQLPRMTAILIDGSRRSVIFAAPDGGKPSIVSEGGHIGGFTVQAIEPERVTVLGPDGKRQLRTAFDPALPPPRPASFAGPAAPLFPGIVPPDARPGSLAPAPYPPPTMPALGAGYGLPPGAAR